MAIVTENCIRIPFHQGLPYVALQHGNVQEIWPQMKVLDARVGTPSTLITSQLPINACHAFLDHRTLVDAILDRAITLTRLSQD